MPLGENVLQSPIRNNVSFVVIICSENQFFNLIPKNTFFLFYSVIIIFQGPGVIVVIWTMTRTMMPVAMILNGILLVF